VKELLSRKNWKIQGLASLFTSCYLQKTQKTAKLDLALPHQLQGPVSFAFNTQNLNVCNSGQKISGKNVFFKSIFTQLKKDGQSFIGVSLKGECLGTEGRPILCVSPTG